MQDIYILGISCYYHDSSAALLKNGQIVAAAQEERFTRKKHDSSFPEHAIKFCLEQAKIKAADLTYVAFYEKPILKFERVLSQHLEMFPKSLKTFVSSMPSWLNQKLAVTKKIKKSINYPGDILFIEHHLAHAASSYFCSSFTEAAILSIDGVGEWTTVAIGSAKENSIILDQQIKFPHSIGLLYSTVTAYLGFSVNNSEYKVMGLSAYGDMNPKSNIYYQKMKKVVDVKEDGSFFLDMSYFTYHFADKMPSRKFCRLMDGDSRKAEEEVTQRHEDIAAAVQLITEEVETKILNYLFKRTNSQNLVVSGGVGLNSVYNGKILKNTPFKNIYIHPDPGDGGTSVGVAMYAYFNILGFKKRTKITHAYFGPTYQDGEVNFYLKENQIKYRKFKNSQELVKTVAKLIFENQVIGFFQKGMEWGPRALGARSILSNPTNPQMQEILNLKVKHREKFRPFAPVVSFEDTEEFFEVDNPLPDPLYYMLMVYPIKKKWQKKIPAVTHVDGSGRLQVIKKEQNDLCYKIIKEFEKLSGIPILINTSFNIRGEPIVCTPKDAYRCMMGTGIDYLVMGSYLIKRDDNPKDMWDSERYAED